MPPIKLTRAQKAERDLERRLAPFKQEISKLSHALLKNTEDAETYRWAALELYRTIISINPQHAKVKLAANRALEVAREAQSIILYN